ncbi:hypothetical protein [Bradyrhizobium vignae]|uniref:hypothetical protein n=1 Tax=Bradyrhizobium vignae TaxID=1549949 RepID=UPI00100A9235|nr:hypothetical protein [Bradyrhizobium vignae]RXG97211.1 hypothetical protein EAV90_22895 [Bradyrhizobium vignae]
MDNQVDSHELVLAIEGERGPRQIQVSRSATAKEVIEAVVLETKRPELTEVFLEDEEECLAEDRRVVELVIEEFRLIHIASKGKITVTVVYNSRQVHRDFAPSVTIETIIAWAISPSALNLEGVSAEYQLKLGSEVLPPDLHLGQIAKGEKKIAFSLVFRIKPQGAS